MTLDPSPLNPDELRAILAQLDITREELAQLIGVSAAAVNSWSIGRRPLSGPAAILLRLAHEARSIIKDDVRAVLRAHMEAIE